MADDKEQDPTDESTPASGDPTRDQAAPATDHAVEPGSESHASRPMESAPLLDGAAADVPAAVPVGDVPEELREDGQDLDGQGLDDTDFDERDPDGQDPDDQDSDGHNSDDQELVTVGAPVRRIADPDAKGGSVALGGRAKKDKVTPRQKRVVETERRTGPVTFVKESVGELRKVVYPTGQQLLQYFVVVLIFVLFIIGIVSLLDLGFGWAIFKIFS